MEKVPKMRRSAETILPFSCCPLVFYEEGNRSPRKCRHPLFAYPSCWNLPNKVMGHIVRAPLSVQLFSLTFCRRFGCGSDVARIWFGCGSDVARTWFGWSSDVFSNWVRKIQQKSRERGFQHIQPKFSHRCISLSKFPLKVMSRLTFKDTTENKTHANLYDCDPGGLLQNRETGKPRKGLGRGLGGVPLNFGVLERVLAGVAFPVNWVRKWVQSGFLSVTRKRGYN